MAKNITQKVPQRKIQREEEEAFLGSLCLPDVTMSPVFALIDKQSGNYFIYGSGNPTVLLSG